MSTAQWGQRARFALAAYDSMLWIVGGALQTGQNTVLTYGDVWRSEDAANWQLVSGNAIFVNRTSFALLPLGGTLTLFGGVEEISDSPNLAMRFLHDVWTSTVSRTWLRAPLVAWLRAPLVLSRGCVHRLSRGCVHRLSRGCLHHLSCRVNGSTACRGMNLIFCCVLQFPAS